MVLTDVHYKTVQEQISLQKRTWANDMELAYLDANYQMEHWVFLVQIK